MRLCTPFLILAMLYGAMPNQLVRQIVPPLLFTMGIIWERAAWLTSDIGGDLTSDVPIVDVANAIGMAMVKRRVSQEGEVVRRFEAEQTALAAAERALAELKTMRGIIPICSHYKKVKTEPGLEAIRGVREPARRCRVLSRNLSRLSPTELPGLDRWNSRFAMEGGRDRRRNQPLAYARGSALVSAGCRSSIEGLLSNRAGYSR